MHIAGKTKRAFASALSLLLFLCLILTSNVLLTNAAQLTVTIDGDVKKNTESADYGSSVGLRFNATATFNSAAIQFNIGPNGGKEVTAILYKWNKDMNTTLQSEPVAVRSYDSWNKNDYLGVYASDAGLSNFKEGEYYLKCNLDKGSSFRFYWYSPRKDNVEGFIGDYFKMGTPGFVIDHNGDSSTFLGKLSARGKGYTNPAPAETVLADDSAVKVLGVDSTLWKAVDGLGRTLPSYDEIGNKKDRLVGIFYWTWHNNNARSKPANLNSILDEHPDAIRNYNHSVWNNYGGYAFFWNEPLFGYYTEMDDYVLRKHAELLADAGIDFVLFDCTNETLLFEDEFLNLLKIWKQAKEEGVNVPKISFMLPFSSTDYNAVSIKNLFYKIYRQEQYQDMWFYWEGKPMLMGIKKALSSADEEERDILNFFTFRKGEPSYWLEDSTDDEWGWLHVYPQAKYLNEDGTVEQMTVGIAQNADYVKRVLYAMNGPNNMGRGFSMQEDFSYTYTYRGCEIVCSSKMENAHYYGINFQEQWDYALETDPEIVFVTGWNEWLVGRYENWEGQENAFPDQCNDENSRDIEPTKGELKDYYYYQLVANVRRYKGMSKPEFYDAKTIDINAGKDQWNEGVFTYNHYINNTLERDAKGFQGTHYTAEATRNDFKTLKASYDDNNLYFYAETVNPITSYTDNDWIRLILDTGAATESSRDWEEFEYIIGRNTGTKDTLELEKSLGGWNWEKVADVRYTVDGNVIQIEVPRSALGLTDDKFTVGFKWADNNLKDGDIMTLYTDGDSAPGGRFTFLLSNIETKEVPSSDELKDKDDGNTEKGGCSGCGGSLTAGSVIFVSASFACAVFVAKKKKK